MYILEISVLATLPALFWLWWFYRQDRLDPEPRGLVLKVFLLGMLPVLPAGILEVLLLKAVPGLQGANIAAVVLSQLLVVAPIEEYGKYLVVRRWAYRNPAFNEPLDGIIYAAAAALGFAALENIFYLVDKGAWLIFLRAPFSTLAHVLFSAFWGYALGMAWAQTDPRVAVRLIRHGLIYAVLGHATFNIFLTAPTAGALYALLILLVIPLMILLYRQAAANIHSSIVNSPFQLRVGRPDKGPEAAA